MSICPHPRFMAMWVVFVPVFFLSARNCRRRLCIDNVNSRKFARMRKERGLLFMLLAYIGVLAAIPLSVGVAFSNVDFPSLASRRGSEREKTILDERIASAREIKTALSKPIAPPAPLPPITAKRANPVPSAVAAISEKPKKPKLSPTARNALAMGQQTEAAHGSPAAPTFDRAAGVW